MHKVRITENENNQRLDRFLRKYFVHAPLSTIHKIIRKKQLRVNGEHLQGNNRIYTGDEIVFYISEENIKRWVEPINVIEAQGNLDIVYEDHNILVLNKPVGILSHPASAADYGKTLIDRVITYLIQTNQYIPRKEKTFTPALVNRLDRNTGGIVVAAKNAFSLQILNEAFKNRTVDKYYRTLVKGHLLTQDTVKAFLHKEESKNKTYINTENKGKEIITSFETVRFTPYVTDLKVKLVTGRTHQIRSQLSYLGYPILGDSKYGDKHINKTLQKDFNIHHQILFSYEIAFRTLPDLADLEGKSFQITLPTYYNKIYKTIKE